MNIHSRNEICLKTFASGISSGGCRCFLGKLSARAKLGCYMQLFELWQRAFIMNTKNLIWFGKPVSVLCCPKPCFCALFSMIFHTVPTSLCFAAAGSVVLLKSIAKLSLSNNGKRYSFRDWIKFQTMQDCLKSQPIDQYASKDSSMASKFGSDPIFSSVTDSSEKTECFTSLSEFLAEASLWFFSRSINQTREGAS